MERETLQIKTPGGHDVVLKSYITGREVQQIENIVFNNIGINGDKSNPNFKMNTGFITEQTNKSLELIVVSVDGQTENILDKILDLKAEDYKFIVAEVNKITEGLNAEKKTE